MYYLTITNKEKHPNTRGLYLSGESMDELIDKIIEWQTMSESEADLYSKKGRLVDELNSGWWLSKSKNLKSQEDNTGN